MRHLTRTIAATVGAGALAATLSFGGAGAAGAAAPARTSAKPTVEVGDNFYKPVELEVTAGTKVTWVNKGRILHNVVPAKGDKWGTKSLTRGKKYSYRFKKPGRYVYYCSFHGSPTGGQRGVVVVTQATPPTTTTAAAAPAPTMG